MTPKSKQQLKIIRESSIRKILDAALTLFGSNGYDATSINMIARKAGVSKGLIYNYFDSKEHLLKVLMEDLTELGEKMLDELYSEDPKEMIENIINTIFRELRDRPNYYHLITSLALQVGKFDFIHEMATTKMREQYQMMEDLLLKAGIKNPKQEAQMLGALFDGIAIQYLVIGPEYPLNEYQEFLIKKYCRNG